jgi:hypothetical protein
MRTIILFAIVSVCLTAGFRPGEHPAVPAVVVQQNEANIGFEWAFGVLGKTDSLLIPVSIAHDTVLKSGDEIKMMVKLTKDCYVYLVHYSSTGEINLLFPYQIRQFQSDYSADKNYYIPKGRNWNMLDNNTGKEIFFLVASNERLLDLEVKLGNYFSADPVKRQPLADEVVSEIRGARKRYSSFATLAEKPLTIGGNVRGTGKAEKNRRPDVSAIAMQISANNFYFKTFTIDHQ